MREDEFVAVRPPGFWPWFVDQLLDARQAVRKFARRQTRRHGLSCAGCGLGNAFTPVGHLDAADCDGCGRRVTGLQVHSRGPISRWVLGV